MRSVTVNGQNWTDFDGAQEWVRIKAPGQSHYTVEVGY